LVCLEIWASMVGLLCLMVFVCPGRFGLPGDWSSLIGLVCLEIWPAMVGLLCLMVFGVPCLDLPHGLLSTRPTLPSLNALTPLVALSLLWIHGLCSAT
ncbi:hypothetical protein SOVF_132310, partial [Spinacia oleracea]